MTMQRLRVTAANIHQGWERFAIITLDGNSLTLVVEADEQTGTAVCLVSNGRDGVERDSGGETARETILHGCVEIGLRPDAPKYAWAAYWLSRLGWGL